MKTPSFFRSFLDYARPWYMGYAFQGAVALGLAPIFLPLYVGNLRGTAIAGIVVAVFYLAQMSAPLFGWISDRYNAHRYTYLLGYVLIGLGTGCFPIIPHLGFWIFLTFLQGLGIAATNTACGMFIVEFEPRKEWDVRVGLLQTLYGTGQSLGLLLAAVLSHNSALGLYVCGILMIPGILLGLLRLPAIHLRKPVKTLHHKDSHVSSRSTHSLFAGIHRPNPATWPKKIARLFSPFLIYILSWFLIMEGNWLIYNLYPLLMKKLYLISPAVSSLYYGIAAGIGIFAYPASGILAKRYGERAIIMAGMAMCLISTCGMVFFAYWPNVSFHRVLVPLFFFLQPIAWSPLIVVGTAFVTKLTNIPQGDSLGIFNATTAFASLTAALAAGFIANSLGYASVVLLSVVVTFLSLLLMRILAWKLPAPSEKQEKTKSSSQKG